MSRRIIKSEDIINREKNVMNQKNNDEKLEETYVNSDHPITMENGAATALYIIVMLVGAIFIDKWWIWITATLIYFKFINRHADRKKKWDKMQKEKKENGGN